MSPQIPKTVAVALALVFVLATEVEQALGNGCDSSVETGEWWKHEEGKGYCRRVIWGWKLRDCEKFLRQTCRWRRGESCREHLEECCLELEEIGRECVCDGVRHVVMRRLRDLQGKMRREMVQKARNLPAFCSMGIGRCYVPKFSNF